MCGRLDIRISEDDALYLRARDLHLDRCTPATMDLVPVLMTGAFLAGRWGIPRTPTGQHIHARSEEGPTTWASSWHTRRGIIPVVGWWEGTWHVTVRDCYLAALTAWYPDGLRIVVVTKPGGALADRIERLPVSLSAEGAADWLGGGDITQQVTDLTVVSRPYAGTLQATLFDVT